MVIFRPKKRSGIAVRVGERTGTWQAKRPTTHKYRVKEKQSEGAVFLQHRKSQWVAAFTSHSHPDIRLLSSGTHQDGTRASLAPHSAYYSFCFRFAGVVPSGGDSARFCSRAVPFPAASSAAGLFPLVLPRFFPFRTRACGEIC